MIHRFPSPIGDLFYLIRVDTAYAETNSSFPSPIGDLFYLIEFESKYTGGYKIVSVPYRGLILFNPICR